MIGIWVLNDGGRGGKWGGNTVTGVEKEGETRGGLVRTVEGEGEGGGCVWTGEAAYKNLKKKLRRDREGGKG